MNLTTRYQAIRQQSAALCAPLSTEDYVVQPITDVSPPKWHLGHTTWFFENFLLLPYLEDYQAFHPAYPYFFNSYYESQGPRVHRAQRGNMTRPAVEDIYRYRQHVDAHLLVLLERLPQLPPEAAFTLEVGLHHEQQHQELLVTDIKYILGNNPLFPAYAPSAATAPTPAPHPAGWIELPAGHYRVGHAGADFCWDNERSAHEVYLGAYALQDRLVTNGEYAAFMAAGGYTQYEHWLADGWDWVKTLETPAPLYWYLVEGEWYHYTLQGLQPIDWHLPVTHLSYYEADAYARWRGLRLPTEQEWEVAANLVQPQIEGRLLENGGFHPGAPLPAAPTQMVGDVWEWTASAYLPYPHYPRFAGALGEYNGKFMINQMVLRGGSVATPQSHLRLSYRNFFQPDKRWQFTGLRLAQ